MLSNGFARPLRLKRKPSLILAGFLITVHVMGLIALLQPLAVNTLALYLLYASLMFSAVYHVAFFRRQIDDQECWIWSADGTWHFGNTERRFSLVLSKSVQTPWFVTLTLADSDKQLRVLIVRDQLDADTFRRLRVRVKLYQEDTAASREEPV